MLDLTCASTNAVATAFAASGDTSVAVSLAAVGSVAVLPVLPVGAGSSARSSGVTVGR
jgi:hypothetical protein